MAFISCIILIVVIDQWIKNYIEKTRDLKQANPILGGHIILTKGYNKGAFLGILRKKPRLLKAINLLVISGLGVYFIKLLFEKGAIFMKVSLAFLLGGAISNVYDRLKRSYVVDYFSFRLLKKVVFNLGDMFIFLGVIFLFLGSLFTKK